MRLIFVERLNIFVRELAFIPVFFHGLADDFTAVNKHPPLGAVEFNSVVAATGHVHFHPVIKFAYDVEIVCRVVTIVDNGITIFKIYRVLSIRPINRDRTLSLAVHTQRPSRDIDVVSTPIGKFTARIFVPPTELVMTAFFTEVYEWSLSQPHFPIQFLGHIGHREGTAYIAAIDTDRNFLDVSEKPFLHHVHGTQKQVTSRPLLGPNKEHFVFVLFTGIANQLIFFQRQRQRLLAKYMLARFECFDTNLNVPMIRCDDTHHVDIIAFEHFTIIRIGVCFALADFIVVFCSISMSFVDITDGDDVTKISMAASVPGAHTSDTDTTDLRAVIFR